MTVLKKRIKPLKKKPAKIPKKKLSSGSSKAILQKSKRHQTLLVVPRVRLEVVYKGRVQGVGFRFNAEQAALDCGVTGWVRNEQNGDVRLVAEGSEDCLLKLLVTIRQCNVGRHIRKEQIRWECSRNEFDDFKIEYHL